MRFGAGLQMQPAADVGDQQLIAAAVDQLLQQGFAKRCGAFREAQHVIAGSAAAANIQPDCFHPGQSGQQSSQRGIAPDDMALRAGRKHGDPNRRVVPRESVEGVILI